MTLKNIETTITVTLKVTHTPTGIILEGGAVGEHDGTCRADPKGFYLEMLRAMLETSLSNQAGAVEDVSRLNEVVHKAKARFTTQSIVDSLGLVVGPLSRESNDKAGEHMVGLKLKFEALLDKHGDFKKLTEAVMAMPDTEGPAVKTVSNVVRH